jgi:SNF2 family DNA or RNA helicase
LINISFNSDTNSLIISEVLADKSKFLLTPLNKLYFKNSFNGIFEIESLSWEIPFTNHSIINEIIIHLTKYNEEYILDDGCKEILQGDAEQKLEYQQKLQHAEKSKVIIEQNEADNLHELLSKGFLRKLTPTQFKALYHLIQIENGANFSVPGSGKTSVALAYYHYLKVNKLVDGIFVIGPASVFEPWETEYYECFKQKPKCLRLAGYSKVERRKKYIGFKNYELFLNTYHSSVKDIDEIITIFKNKRFLLILDESHYIKRPQGGVIAEAVMAIGIFACRKIILTGTPMPNGLPDLWSQITFLWPDQEPLSDVDSYLNDINNNPEKKFLETKKEINPFFFRITKKQLELPKPYLITRKIKLSPIQQQIYKGVAIQFLNELNLSKDDKFIFRELRRARAVRLLQIASNPSLLRKSCDEFMLPRFDINNLNLREIIDKYSEIEIPSKIKLAAKIIHDVVTDGRKVILWSSFVHNLEMLNKLLESYNPTIIHGGIPYNKTTDEIELSREKNIWKFKNDESCKILLANPAACAESISLHKVCHDAIYLDRSFNCAHYMQSMDRIHRIGLKKDDIIKYYIIKAKGTIDEVVDQRLKVKMKNMSQILEGELPTNYPGYWGNDLGDQEILDYDAVDEHIRNLLTKNGS